MTDAALHWDDAVYAGDVGLSGADLVREEGLRTAVIVSLFSDRRAEPGDIPEGEDPRGWWGDAIAEDDDRIGSRLWLLGRSKQTPDVPVRAEEYAREALAWFVEDGIADRVDVSAEWAGQGRLCITPVISGGGGVFEEAFLVSVTGPSGGPVIVNTPLIPPPNQPPGADAGANQNVAAGVRVTLDGSASADPDGSIATYAWAQTAGDNVALTDDDTATPEFDAPSTGAAQTLTFRLTVTDDGGGSATDTVDVAVLATGTALALSAWSLPAGRTQRALMLLRAGISGDTIYSHADRPPALGALVDGVDTISVTMSTASRVTGVRRTSDAEIRIHDNPDADNLNVIFGSLLGTPRLHIQTAGGVYEWSYASGGGNFANFTSADADAQALAAGIDDDDLFILSITSG